MHTIVPHLWFDTQAKEAAEFYVSVFQNSTITDHSVLTGTPSGDCDVMSFELRGQPFMSISAGPLFTFNPSVSFMVNFDPSREKDAREQLDAAWEKLSEGGKVLMPLQEYPFSKHYGWIQDKFGLSWQLILTDLGGDPRPEIIPALLFVQENCGKGEEAAEFYLSVFKDSQMGELTKWGPGMAPEKEGSVMFADLRLLDMWFAIMDSAQKHEFQFNEAVSFMVRCKDQEEIDYYWEALSAVPEGEQCGWLKDKFGLSWQITPVSMDEMMKSKDKAALQRVTEAFLQMKKFDLATLEKAYKGE